MVVMTVWVGSIGCLYKERELEWVWDAMGEWYLWYAEKSITDYIYVITFAAR